MRVLNPARGVGGLVASGSVHSTAERAVWIEVLAGDIVLCSWPRHFTLTESFPTRVYQWVPPNLMLGVTLRWTSIPSRGRRSTPSLLILLMSHVARMQSLPSFDPGKIRILRCCFCRGNLVVLLSRIISKANMRRKQGRHSCALRFSRVPLPSGVEATGIVTIMRNIQ